MIIKSRSPGKQSQRQQKKQIQPNCPELTTNKATFFARDQSPIFQNMKITSQMDNFQRAYGPKTSHIVKTQQNFFTNSNQVPHSAEGRSRNMNRLQPIYSNNRKPIALNSLNKDNSPIQQDFSSNQGSFTSLYSSSAGFNNYNNNNYNNGSGNKQLQSGMRFNTGNFQHRRRSSSQSRLQRQKFEDEIFSRVEMNEKQYLERFKVIKQFQNLREIASEVRPENVQILFKDVKRNPVKYQQQFFQLFNEYVLCQDHELLTFLRQIIRLEMLENNENNVMRGSYSYREMIVNLCAFVKEFTEHTDRHIQKQAQEIFDIQKQMESNQKEVKNMEEQVNFYVQKFNYVTEELKEKNSLIESLQRKLELSQVQLEQEKEKNKQIVENGYDCNYNQTEDEKQKQSQQVQSDNDKVLQVFDIELEKRESDILQLKQQLQSQLQKEKKQLIMCQTLIKQSEDLQTNHINLSEKDLEHLKKIVGQFQDLVTPSCENYEDQMKEMTMHMKYIFLRKKLKQIYLHFYQQKHAGEGKKKNKNLGGKRVSTKEGLLTDLLSPQKKKAIRNSNESPDIQSPSPHLKPAKQSKTKQSQNFNTIINLIRAHNNKQQNSLGVCTNLEDENKRTSSHLQISNSETSQQNFEEGEHNNNKNNNKIKLSLQFTNGDAAEEEEHKSQSNGDEEEEDFEEQEKPQMRQKSKSIYKKKQPNNNNKGKKKIQTLLHPEKQDAPKNYNSNSIIMDQDQDEDSMESQCNDQQMMERQKKHSLAIAKFSKIIQNTLGEYQYQNTKTPEASPRHSEQAHDFEMGFKGQEGTQGTEDGEETNGWKKYVQK